MISNILYYVFDPKLISQLNVLKNPQILDIKL